MDQAENNKPEISALQAKHELWRRGRLSYKLDKNQQELYKLFHETNHKIQTWLLSRRSGKTYTLLVLAFERCIKYPGSIVKFVSPTRLQVQTNVRPLIRQITEDCPQDLIPEFKTNDFIYYFPNKSELQLAGSESGHAEKLRGGSSNISIIDEAQDVTDLDDIIKSILLPTTLTTNGKIVMAGTPPKSIDHSFVSYVEQAEARGSLVKKIVYDNPRISKEDIDIILQNYPGGVNDEAFRREYLCEMIKDQNISVIPEFTKELEELIVKEWPKPPFFDAYVAMDLGMTDLTAVVFGYYDFRAGKIIIEDELEIDFTEKDSNIKTLTEKIKAKESELWTSAYTGEVRVPYMRVSDINPIVTKEISVISNGEIYFTDTKKDDKATAINNTRLLLANQKVIIHPRCKNLIRHLRNVKWASAKNHLTFGRSPDNGHYDFADALIYLTRTIVFSKNPYPSNYNVSMQDMHIRKTSNGNYNSLTPIQVYQKIFGVKPKNR